VSWRGKGAAGEVRPGEAGLGAVWQVGHGGAGFGGVGQVRCGKTRQGRAWRGRQGAAGLGMVRQGFGAAGEARCVAAW